MLFSWSLNFVDSFSASFRIELAAAFFIRFFMLWLCFFSNLALFFSIDLRTSLHMPVSLIILLPSPPRSNTTFFYDHFFLSSLHILHHQLLRYYFLKSLHCINIYQLLPLTLKTLFYQFVFHYFLLSMSVTTSR